MRWQKQARIAVAVFGVASAIGVYALMGERARPVPAEAPTRLDPKAVIESRGNILQQVRGTRQDFVIEAAQQLTYEGGATKLIGIKVSVKNRGGRDYVITAREAQAAERQEELRLTGDVTLAANDGFQITTTEAFFSEGDGTVRAPQAFQFRRGRLSGTGVGMNYDKNNDILTIGERAEVVVAGEEEGDMSFSAGSATFSRPTHLLQLAGAVHAVRGSQVMDASETTAHLSEDDSRVTMLALRGQAVVSGSGQGLDGMNGEAIDLHYAEDGQTIQRLQLSGAARVSMTSQGTTRNIEGERLEFTLAPDGTPTSLIGREGVRLDLPAGSDAPARIISAMALDGSGQEGRGLTAVHFQDQVEFREGGGTTLRRATATALDVQIDGNAVQSAVFTGDVRFVQEGLQGSGGRAVYEPAADALRLSRATGGPLSRLADNEVTVEASTIDVTLGSRRISARESVKTALTPGIGGGRGASRRDQGRLPGLLKQEQAANVSGDSFQYEGAAGTATYNGNATLVQGDTAIRAATISIDQGTGNLTASGDARATIPLETGRSVGRAARVAYTDAQRVIAFTGGPAAGTTPPAMAQLSGPHGELRAEEIRIVLAAEGSRADRLEAFRGVDLTVDARRVTGSRLTYFAAGERYELDGTGIAPVKVVERCREISGRTLIFFKSTDRIIVDGNEEIRTQTTGSTCAQPPPRPR